MTAKRYPTREVFRKPRLQVNLSLDEHRDAKAIAKAAEMPLNRWVRLQIIRGIKAGKRRGGNNG